MEKITCNVIQDILPLYIDHEVCDDTERLVEAHLQECESCRSLFHDLEKEFLAPADSKEAEKEAEELKSFKRFLSRKKLRTIFVSITGALLLAVCIIIFMNQYMRPIRYREVNFSLIEENEDEVSFKDSISGHYRWYSNLDRDTGIMTVSYKQTLWDRYIAGYFDSFDHIHTFLKKDMVKVVYLDPDGTETTVWEASEEEKETYFRQERGALG